VHPWSRPSLRDALDVWRFWYIGVLAAPAAGGWLLRNRPGFVRLLIRSWSARNVWTDQELRGFAVVGGQGGGERRGGRACV
jgi:hypothetical protein